jgi:dGTPase
MLQSRKEREDFERAHLAPYAARSAETLGRRQPETPHPTRAEFQRDRDRIIHSRAFRRLEYKTQVFINGTADHYRTRLTHTFEMTAVGRTIARALGANEDLTECIALAHDIGHSPFGHSGEAALDELMRDHGGFDHNIQSLRWVEHLEPRYPGRPGLNLTWEVRAGLYKHQAALPGFQLDGHPIGPHQMIEGQIADVADDMTYYAHDVDDGLDAGLIGPADLEALEVWRIAVARAAAEFPEASPAERLGVTVRSLLDLQVEDVLRHSGEMLAKYRPASAREVMVCPERVVAFSPRMQELLRPLREFLFERVYWHPSVAGANREAVELMRKLFLFYVANPASMGGKARARIPADGVYRAACDYVSGMTDRYALQEIYRFGLANVPAAEGSAGT